MFCYINCIAASYKTFEVDDKGHFKYFFFSFGASITGWYYCRLVITVDGTFLTNKYKRTLLSAAAIDGDKYVFPLVLGIVDLENDASWLWFFKQIKCAIREREDLVTILDCNHSILKAIMKVYRQADHVICVLHLYNNVKTKFRHSSIKPLFNRCVMVYTMKEFEFYMDALHSINPGIKEYLLHADPFKWARSHFERKRYNVMTTNTSECLNAILNIARDRPIVSLVEAYCKVLQQWFFKHRSAGLALESKLTIWVEIILQNQEEIARTLRVRELYAIYLFFICLWFVGCNMFHYRSK